MRGVLLPATEHTREAAKDASASDGRRGAQGAAPAVVTCGPAPLSVAAGGSGRVGPARALLLACVLLLPPSACGGAGDGASAPLLDELERFAWVPEASVRLAPGAGPVVGNARPLLVERFETTRGQAKEFLASLPPDPARERLLGEPEGAANLPVTGLTLEEARALCATRGLRLLTAGWWLRCALGRQGADYPFGGRWVSVANTVELGLRHPVPVGSFGQGVSPDGLHDLAGNVAEWVDEPLDGPEGLAWAMGGSWASLLRPTVRIGSGGGLDLSRLELDPASRDETVGLRACADAEEWLAARAQSLPRDPSARERLRALGRAWGPQARATLDRLRQSHPAPAFDWLREGAGS